MEERGGLLEPGWGLPGGVSRRAVRKGMAPGNRQLLEKPEEIFINCLQVCPVGNLGPRQHWRGRVRVEREAGRVCRDPKTVLGAMLPEQLLGAPRAPGSRLTCSPISPASY